MKYSDIQIMDRVVWERYKTAWSNGDYSAVISQELDGKKLNAATLNEITERIVEAENVIKDGAEDFKANKIPCQALRPIQQSGEVWFQVMN